MCRSSRTLREIEPRQRTKQAVKVAINNRNLFVSNQLISSIHHSPFHCFSTNDENEDDDISIKTSVLVTRMECCCCCCCCSNARGTQSVRVKVTVDFLEFTRAVGNNLRTPAPECLFPGLREDGDVWCL